eukprot:1146199-Pelagomonas_calceolata.AAC.10
MFDQKREVQGDRCSEATFGKSLAYTLKSLSTTIYRPDTPGELDHWPLSRQKSQCVQGTNTSTAVETKQQFLDTHQLISKQAKSMSGGRGPENKGVYLAKEPLRAGVGVCTFEKSMLFILHIILGITKVTGRRNAVIPRSLLSFESVSKKAKPGHTAHDVFGQIQVQILG